MKRKFTKEHIGDDSFLTYQLAPEDVLDLCSLGMMKCNQIKGFLPICHSQLNQQQTLTYTLLTMLPLSQFLKKELSRKQILEILIGVTRTMDACNEWILSPARIVTEFEYVMVHSTSNKVSFVYLPLQSRAEQFELTSYLITLLDEIKIDTSEQDWFKSIYVLLESGDDFSQKSFLSQLEKWLADIFVKDRPIFNAMFEQSLEANETVAAYSTTKHLPKLINEGQSLKKQNFFSRIFTKQ